ncbi:WhiB family transcriptional regulator [Streptomyces sp. NPDC047071]|uniref:WhiB family transcriptional regulator n=1 Tax=Streptomyces sp. NPDC047071 TaxID=3154808 RepID=UPI0034542C7C
MHIDTTVTEAELAWQEQALCAQTGPEFFFPDPGSSVREAKRICRLCDMRSACLAYALDNDERFGVWGGLSEKERQSLRRERVSRTA